MDIGNKTNSILDTTKVQVARIDELLNDASVRAKVQLERAEMVLDDAMDKTQSTVGLIHRGHCDADPRSARRADRLARGDLPPGTKSTTQRGEGNRRRRDVHLKR